MSSPSDAGRVIIITGASSGIGRSAARQLADRGDRLVLAARRRAALEVVATDCRRRGAEVLVVPADVGDNAAVESLARRAEERFGRVDAWLHTVGLMAYGDLVDVPSDIVEEVVRVNVLGVLNVARASLPRMREQETGTLVIVGSLLGRIAVPGMGTYVSTKWAVRAIVRTLALEQRDRPGVHVCELWPGATDTPIYAAAATYGGFEGRPPPPVTGADRVARRAVALLDRPRLSAPVGPGNRLVTTAFTLVPKLYDVLVGPLARLATHGPPAGDDPGNVREPRSDDGSVSGGWTFTGRARRPGARTPGAPPGRGAGGGDDTPAGSSVDGPDGQAGTRAPRTSS